MSYFAPIVGFKIANRASIGKLNTMIVKFNASAGNSMTGSNVKQASQDIKSTVVTRAPKVPDVLILNLN